MSAIAVSSFLSSGVIKTSVLTRFLFEEEETKTITSRVSYWKDALEIGLRSPFVGVGLGNYFDNLSTSSKKTNETSQIDRYRKFIFIDDPHSIFFSIFATTGIIGLLSFLSVLSFFLIRDLSGIRSQNELPTLIICMFWGLFIFSLMNPWVNFSYLSFMFLIRGFCEN